MKLKRVVVGDAPLDGGNNLQWPRMRLDENGNPSDQEDNECTSGIEFAAITFGCLSAYAAFTLSITQWR